MKSLEKPEVDAVSARTRLNRSRVLERAVSLADEIGIDALSMRRLAAALDVVPMALYKHVANREELLDGMVDVIIAEIHSPTSDEDWRSSVRNRVLAARAVFQRHPWARRVIESRTTKTPAVLGYIEAITGMFLAGGFSVDLTHHAMHAFGGRMWGFTQEVFDDSTEESPEVAPEVAAQMMEHAARLYPNIVAVAMSSSHDGDSIVGRGCDDEFEFEFALDLLLDGFERMRQSGWNSRAHRAGASQPA